MHRRQFLPLLLLLFTAACDSGGPTATGPGSQRALVAEAPVGRAGFHFLPPLASASTAPNDATLLARLAVEVCAEAGPCITPAVKLADGHYVAHLQLKGSSARYRIRVRGDGFELGRVDVTLDGSARTLPIKFIVERGTIPAPQPPNDAIVFTSQRDGNWEIYTVRADGGAETRLTDHPADDYWGSWSNDRSKILFMSNRAAGPDTEAFDLYTMNVDGSNVTRLTSGPEYEGFASYSPDGSKIVYASNRSGSFDIWVMNADGTNHVRLTTGGDYEVSPRWSPLGNRILFRARVSGNWDLYAMDTDGTDITRLTDDPGSDLEGNWSLEAGRIVYWSNASGAFRIWTMHADGSNKTMLPPVTAGDQREPDFSPDGTHIVFSASDQLWISETGGANPRRISTGIRDWQSKWR